MRGIAGLQLFLADSGDSYVTAMDLLHWVWLRVLLFCVHLFLARVLLFGFPHLSWYTVDFVNLLTVEDHRGGLVIWSCETELRLTKYRIKTMNRSGLLLRARYTLPSSLRSSGQKRWNMGVLLRILSENTIIMYTWFWFFPEKYKSTVVLPRKVQEYRTCWNKSFGNRAHKMLRVRFFFQNCTNGSTRDTGMRFHESTYKQYICL